MKNGDKNAAAQPDFGDISGMVAKFKAIGSKCLLGANNGVACTGAGDCPDGTCELGAPLKARCQLLPNAVDPSGAINFNDISFDVKAFQGNEYAAGATVVGPCTCPSSVTCGATACLNDFGCAEGPCLGGFCTDACSRCAP